MKLRIKGQSIRLRLTQSELTTFTERGSIEETLRFPGGRRLVYSVETSTEVEGLVPEYDGERLSVRMPREWVSRWADSDRVGFESTHPLHASGALTVTIEKDFECLHKRPDDEDAFPHPLADNDSSE